MGSESTKGKYIKKRLAEKEQLRKDMLQKDPAKDEFFSKDIESAVQFELYNTLNEVSHGLTTLCSELDDSSWALLISNTEKGHKKMQTMDIITKASSSISESFKAATIAIAKIAELAKGLVFKVDANGTKKQSSKKKQKKPSSTKKPCKEGRKPTLTDDEKRVVEKLRFEQEMSIKDIAKSIRRAEKVVANYVHIVDKKHTRKGK